MKHKFEYFLNAIHYSMFLMEKKSQVKVQVYGYKVTHFVYYILGNEETFYRRKDRLDSDKKLQEFMYGKKGAFCMGITHHNFGYLYSCYTGILSFILLGFQVKYFENIDDIVKVIIIASPIALGYIPAYKAVLSKDRYLKFYKRFEKEDENWHMKWKRITIAFCIGGFLSTILGIVTAFLIAT